ncbi:Predicted cell-wall-anchored protein SasA (LPXTG motif) [Leuconostoc inhae]|uniref:Predicted cell-wall-anchored protein SasA (LPXTG motif) n=2 Tax=Leuconostoc TaxID=1243 RepID=A0AAN2QWL4_9LACO|nr:MULTISPECIES: hypothetical protein [Leuconostoc]MBZ5958932.1 hypothetical protein [Leuconostoc gasicomitatum]MBZ5982093.1 hypothetical protein [Leuconostoc gasicomitatum]MBZ5989045.1 hypothetical protein [Leuconostoc gasicomitatum]MBZ5989815.1 hypothetical protein [Leuconostoc gasicomitatum]CUR63631.1 Cell surface protein [Leuconostoc gasicomitatum KG16-1]
MFGKKKQTKLSDPFFARIEQSELNLEDGVIHELAESSGLTESWPNVSLSGLQKFAAGLVNDVVRAGGHDVRLGNVVYFITNEKGRAEPTGLSWERATLTAGFENIVVSTADHIFNDTDIRQDEDMSYDIIVAALQPLLDAAVSDGSLSQDDLPVLPTEDQFRQARETGEVLAVEPSKFQRPAMDTASVLETSVTENPKAMVIPQMEKQVPEIETQADSAMTNTQIESPRTQESISDSEQTQKLIDRVNLVPSTFEVSDVKSDLPAESVDYVQSRLNADRVKANAFLEDTSTIYTQKIRQAMTELLQKQQLKTKATVDEMRETDVTQTVDTQLKSERVTEFETRYAQRHQARETDYHTAVTDENMRHETTLTSLKSNYVNDLEALKVSVSQELDHWYLERSKVLQNNLQATVDDQVSEAKVQAYEITVTSLKALRDELLAQNTKSLMTMQQKLEEDINTNRGQYQEAHEKALISATQLESAKTHFNNLSDLEKQIQVLKQSNTQLEQQLKLKEGGGNDELVQLRQQLNNLQATSTSPDQTNQQLMTLLAAQMKQPQVVQKKARGWQSTVIGLLAVLAIGGVGFGGYAMAQQKNDTSAQSSKTVSASSHNEGNATVTLAPESKATTSSSQSSSTSRSSNSSSQANSSSTLADRYHVGENVEATINGQMVTTPVVSVQDKTITVHHDGYDYVVPFDN